MGISNIRVCFNIWGKGCLNPKPQGNNKQRGLPDRREACEPRLASGTIECRGVGFIAWFGLWALGFRLGLVLRGTAHDGEFTGKTWKNAWRLGSY